MRRLLGAVSAGALVVLLAGAPAATAQACRVDEHTMASGDPATDAGAVSLTVDGLGWFGVASFGAREARYRPPDGPELSTVQESVVAVDGVRLQECVTGDAEVVERTPDRFTTTGAVGLTRVRLVQELSPVAADGSTTLTQRYELTPGRLDVSHLDAVRSLAPLLTEGGAVTAAAGRRGGTLAASVPGDGRAAAVGIAGDLDGRAAPDRWTVAAVGEAGTDARMLPAGIANEVAGDPDGDGVTDEPGAYTLAQQWSTGLNAGDTVALTTVTRFFPAAPSEVASWPAVTRVAGADRVTTAAAVSRAAHPPFGADTVVLARADDYPDALAGGPLAHAHGAPILLTGRDRLDAEVIPAINRLRASRAILLGGLAALSQRVEQDLLASTTVTETERIAGADRFDTAARIAAAVGGDHAYLAEGADPDPARGWPDALAVSAPAAALGRPILLTTTAALPAPTRQALAGLGVRRVDVVGGPAAVSGGVEAEVAAQGIEVTRLAGATRYDTAALVADAAVGAGLDPARTWLASGETFPDALVGGPAAAGDGGILLLTDPDALPPPTAGFLRAHADRVEVVTVLGGPAALGGDLVDRIREEIGAARRSAAVHGTWSALAPAPIAGRSQAESVWTGEEMIVWGGLADATGAAYDPAAGRWRAIEPSPFEGDYRHQAVWSGNELLVWGSRDGSPDDPPAGAYDPATDRWRLLPEDPLPPLREPVAVWTGDELLVWGNIDGPQDSEATAGAAYDPATDRWRTIADGPLLSRYGYAAAFTDTELVVWGGSPALFGCDEGCEPRPLRDDGAAYDPASDTWRRIADAPGAGVAGAQPTWTGDEVILLGGYARDEGEQHLAYDPAADAWRTVADPPPAATASGLRAWTGEELLVWSHPTQSDDEDRGGIYRPTADTWTLLPDSGALPRDGATSVWTGGQWLIWGGIVFAGAPPEDLADGLRYVPRR